MCSIQAMVAAAKGCPPETPVTCAHCLLQQQSTLLQSIGHCVMHASHLCVVPSSGCLQRMRDTCSGASQAYLDCSKLKTCYLRWLSKPGQPMLAACSNEAVRMFVVMQDELNRHHGKQAQSCQLLASA